MIKRALITLHISLCLILAMTSCTSDDYIQSIPKNSTALLSIDTKEIGEDVPATLLQKIFPNEDITNTGIDLSDKLFIFETKDGNLGLCAKVKSKSKMKDFLKTVSERSGNGTVREVSGNILADINGTWAAGCSDNALLIIGPVTPAAIAETQRQIVRYLRQDEDKSILATPMYAKLDSIDTPLALVAQADALPGSMTAPFSLGAGERGADGSKVIIAARITISDHIIYIDGETCSFDNAVSKSLHDAAGVFRPIQGKYVPSLSRGTAVALFANVDGRRFLPLLQANPSLQAMLAGINAAIDMDNIVKSINGDMMIQMPTFNTAAPQISLSAQLGNKNWLSDVAYWKQSCPPGSRIADQGKDAYCYESGKTTYFFGVTTDNQFYSGASVEAAQACLRPSKNPVSKRLQDGLTQCRMALFVNISAITSEDESLSSLIKPLTGDIEAIVYRLK